MIFELDNDILGFPDPRYGNPDGAFAIGGDISPERMRLAYALGILPWYPFRAKERIWYCPMERFVIFPSEIHVSHSLHTLINQRKYVITFNRDFEGVIRGCSIGDGIRERRIDDDGAWLGEEMIATLMELYKSGDAMSVEVTDTEGNLVGGLYGIISRHIFCGESMFSKVPSASKLALVALARYVESDSWQRDKITLIDCQFETPHLKSMGGRTISYEEYLLHNGIVLPPLAEDEEDDKI